MNSTLIQPATRRDATVAAIVAALMLLTLALAGQHATRPLPAIEPFMPMCALTVFTTAGIAAFLLIAQFAVTRQPLVGMLGSAYAFAALAVALQLLMFPGVFTPTGLFGARPNSATWMWVFWHGGLPLFVSLAVVLRERLHRGPVEAAHVVRWTWFLVGVPVVLSAALTGMVTLMVLPPAHIAVGSPNALASHPTALVLWAVNVVALLLVLTIGRLRSVLDLWLAIAMLACFTDTSLNLLSAERFTLGWYVSRIFSMFAPGVLVCVLVWEVTTLYQRLFEAHVSLHQTATHDPLTGVYNRTYFNERMGQLLGGTRHADTPLAGAAP